VNLLQAEKDEKVRAFLNVREFSEDKNIIMATKNGTIKKTLLSAYSHPRVNGIIAINLRENDDIVGVKITDGHQDILLGSRAGKAIRFHEKDVREVGRNSTGVKGITLSGVDDVVVDMVTVSREDVTVLAVSENGLGKRTKITDYRAQHRGGKGVITLKTNKKVGKMIALKEVVEKDDLMLISNKGLMIRMPINKISTYSRNTQGVKLINLKEEDHLSSVAYVAESENEEEE